MLFRSTILAMALIVGILNQSEAFYGFEEYAQAILSKAPEGWAIAEKRINIVPEGFHNTDVKGELYVFCGPNKVTWNWKDMAGNWHCEELAHETLEVWILPGNYRPGIGTYLRIKGPVLPSKVYDSKIVKVYVQPSHRLTISKDEFNKIATKASMMYWDDSGGKDIISWLDWKQEMSKALQSAEQIPDTDKFRREFQNSAGGNFRNFEKAGGESKK